MNAEQLVQYYAMLPHPEGGFYKEVYRSEEQIEQQALPARFNGNRFFFNRHLFFIRARKFLSFSSH